MEEGDLHMIESGLIEREHTFRNLKLTKEVLETKRSIIRWLALTIGIINPGESRLSAVPVLDAIFSFQFIQKKDPSVQEMQEYINNSWGSINEKTLRYHLLQLKNMGLIDNKKGEYFLVQSEGSERYDEQAWATYYFNSELDPIKEKVIQVIKVLKSR